MMDVLPRPMAKKEGGLPVVRIQTNKGNIDVELFQKDAPKTVENFLKLSKQGFYNGLHWHRVIDDFMIQGGCPHSRTKGDRRAGTGGPGYTFADETRGNPRRHGAKVLSMANAGPNTNGSQFFITHSPQPHLDGKHTVFGHVIAGTEVVDKVRQWDDIQSITQIEGA
jgi:peptidyl-prolyl cis-trans isomerase B (cyclophilin B)